MTLIRNNEELKSLENIQLIGYEDPYLSITSHTKGIWYMEFVDISGNGSYLVGFKTSYQEISANPTFKYPKLYAYTTGATSLNGNSSFGNSNLWEIDLGISYNRGERIGIGIDIDNGHIFYLYKNIIKSFTFNVTPKEWFISIRATKNYGISENISIYLKDFYYNPPFNARPWYSTIKITCNYHRTISLTYTFFIVFLL